MSEDAGEFDYIVIGAGSSGCVVANRLSADPGTRVLVVEAGGMDNWIWFHIPVGYLFTISNPRSDWCFKTTPQEHMGGREIAFPRGKAIGGSSAINAMLYVRGQAQDYDGWRQLGLTGWGWDDVLPVFMKHEDHMDPPSEFHRSGGELRVEMPRVKWDVLERMRDAAESAGIPKVADYNGGDNEGVCYFNVTQKRGTRFSAARAFLKPVLGRDNLKLELEVSVDRITFEGRRATGIVYRRKDGSTVSARARREVILSAGAIGSPAIMEASGIGQPERLKDLGVDVVHDAPGVGENLQDHLQVRAMYKVTGAKTLNADYYSYFAKAVMGINYALFRKGPLTMSPSQLCAFTRSGPEYETPNIQFHIQPLSLEQWGEGLHRWPGVTASVTNLRPTSRGSVHLAGSDMARDVRIDPNYLATDVDRRVAVQSLRKTRDLMSQPALAPYNPVEHRPGAHAQTDEELLKAAEELGTTIFHPVGTLKMGADSDRMAVCDERLRVRGLEGLRVIDASIMPRITSGNTNAPSIMIGEKGAGMVKEDARARA